MATTHFILRLDGGTCHIARCRGDQVEWSTVTADGATNPPLPAEEIAKSLKELGYAGSPIALLMPSRMCFAATVAADDTRPRRQTLIYQLEEQLPVPAEEFTADFVSSTSVHLGVAVLNASLAAFLSELEAQGVAVDHIYPYGLAALEGWFESGTSPTPDIALIGEGDRVNVLTLCDAQLTAWRLVPPETRAIRSQLAIAGIQKSRRVHVLVAGVNDRLLAELESDTENITALEIAPEALALRGAARATTGNAHYAVDLRRDALSTSDPLRSIRGPLNFAVAACLILMLTLTATFLWRGTQHRHHYEQWHAQQVELFHETLPGQRVPVGIARRMESEAQRLRGVSGQTHELPASPSSLAILYEAMRRLPTELRYRVLEVRIEGDRVYFEGQARSHGDADLIAAPRRQGGFDLQPPKTEKLRDQGVAFTLTGTAPPGSGSDPPAAASTQLAQQPGVTQ